MSTSTTVRQACHPSLHGSAQSQPAKHADRSATAATTVLAKSGEGLSQRTHLQDYAPPLSQAKPWRHWRARIGAREHEGSQPRGLFVVLATADYGSGSAMESQSTVRGLFVVRATADYGSGSAHGWALI